MTALSHPLDEPETFYHEHAGELVRQAADTLNVPEPDAHQLANEILLSSLRHLPTIANPAKWLSGAMNCAARRPGD